MVLYLYLRCKNNLWKWNCGGGSGGTNTNNVPQSAKNPVQKLNDINNVRHKYAKIASKYASPTQINSSQHVDGKIISSSLEFDATASMVQILSVITRNKKFAELTNIYNTNNIKS